jgi:pyruvate formate lyase activating enzyme
MQEARLSCQQFKISKMNKAIIYKIDRLNTHNGPGFRTVIYFKGCHLHCTWCHNPEGISPKKEVWFNATKCIGCGECVSHCPENAMQLSDKGISIDRNKCSGCQKCTEICPSKAMEKIGETYSVEDVFKIVLQDKMLFESSGGGVTVTGGEPGLHIEFIAQLFERCKKEGIHTAFDTSSMLSVDKLEQVIQNTDIVFLDIKSLNNSRSIEYTGLPVAKLLTFIEWIKTYNELHEVVSIEIRTPLIPEITDRITDLKEIATFIEQQFGKNTKWELCMFNDLCEDKYLKLDKHWSFKGKYYNQDQYKQFLSLLEELDDLDISLTGFYNTNAT